MRTAGDVVKRVLWDEKIPQKCITIGYLDRFKGILEKPFDDFSWEPLDSLDYFTFGVPEHRIQYFKYKDIVVWDKRFRIDRVFGSSRSTKTIRDVIENYEKYYCCIDSKLFHLTLSTLRLEGSLQISECMEALRQAETKLCRFVPTNQLTVKGVGNFHGRVLYAAVESNENLNLFVDQLNQILHVAGFHTNDQKKFKPHISLMKMNRSVSKKVGTKKVDPNLCGEFLDTEFGVFTLDSIYLCAMGRHHDDDGGFYRTIGNLHLVNPISK
ncbi:unnamed protein product [Schistosoma rodhaini]|nr:unnamed protein product [Schistosoma rodhaini]